MTFKRYGGPWQVFRAFTATVLIGWAHSIHFRATMDTARVLTELEDEARRRKHDGTCDIPEPRPIYINPQARP